MSRQRSEQLEDALRRKRLVRFSRPFEDGHADGYVLDIGERWFLLALVGDGIRLNGFQCFRLQDVRDLEVPNPHARFYEAALKKRGEQRPRRPRVDLSLEELLRSANRAFPLVTIHTEEDDPDVCWIGRVVGLNRATLTLLQIDPDATWGEEPRRHRLRDITRVDFGGAYEEALYLVGGDPPAGRGAG
jgi:hypothetical protein